jgi:hypothetical protein
MVLAVPSLPSIVPCPSSALAAPITHASEPATATRFIQRVPFLADGSGDLKRIGRSIQPSGRAVGDAGPTA